MSYFVLIILVLVLFFMTRKDRKASDKYLAGALLAFTIAIASLVSYIAKDAYYNNVVNNYFSLPQGIWRFLMFSPVPRNWLIRLINIDSLLVLFFFLQFSLTFLSDTRIKSNKIIQALIITYLGIQMIAYDPLMQTRMYLFFYPEILNVHTIERIGECFHVVTCTINIVSIIYAVGRVVWTNCKITPAYFFRYYAWGECLCFACIAIAYLFIFWFAPMGLVSVSKLANAVSYKSVPLSGNNIAYLIYPYYLVMATLIIMFFLWRSIVNRRKLERNELNIKRQIDAADTTSKTFCHYLKNEILALQAEVETLEVCNAGNDEKEAIIMRCENLYRRLDEIHRTTKMSELILKKTNVNVVMNQILDCMAVDFKNCKVVRECDCLIPNVMLDEVYFEQAIHNILINAKEAMEKETDREGELRVCVDSIDNWVQISITDNGIGISEKNLQRIFTPFYSSAPIKQHWGIGLGLTHKIVMAHGGRIEVESKEHVGTTFRIILPSILIGEL